MKICLAQSEFHGGDIRANLDTHLKLINAAIDHGADAVYFPELSLTGYEPSMAEELHFKPDDIRLLPFNVLSKEKSLIIGLGVPVSGENGISVAMAVFQPERDLLFYHKALLHEDEIPYFVPGENLNAVQIGNGEVALSICYELSVEKHAEEALTGDEKVYLASVAKDSDGVKRAYECMAETAGKHQVFCMMVNAVGNSEDGLCSGNSAVWSPKGKLICRLNATDEGLLILDTETNEVQTVYPEA